MRVLAISWKGISVLLSFKKTADKLLISANSVELGKAGDSVECCTGSLTFNTYYCCQGFRLKLGGKFLSSPNTFLLRNWLAGSRDGFASKDRATLDKDNSSHGTPQLNSGIFTLNFTLKILNSDKLQTWDSLSTTEAAMKVILIHWFSQLLWIVNISRLVHEPHSQWPGCTQPLLFKSLQFITKEFIIKS